MNNKSITILSVIIAFTFCLPLLAWTGSGTYEDPYLISTASDLLDLQANVNLGTTYSGSYFLQTADIELPAANWEGIGSISSDLTTTNAFMGNYDGDGCYISNLTINVSGLGDNQGSKYYGLFGAVDNAVMANVSVQGKIVVKATANVGTEINIGSIVASANGNCLLEGLESYVDVYYENPNTTDETIQLATIGGAIGNAFLSANNTWSGLKNHGNIYVNSPYKFSVSGVIGDYRRGQNNSATIIGLENYGILSSYSSSSWPTAGASVRYATQISGIAKLTQAGNSTIANCVNYGDIVVSNGILYVSGGFVGVSWGAPYPIISACTNHGNIRLIDLNDGVVACGGVFTGILSAITINNSTNAGNILANSKTAFSNGKISGIAAANGNNNSTPNVSITGCVNVGNININEGATSGASVFVATGIACGSPYEDNSRRFKISTCQNQGDICFSSVKQSSSSSRYFAAGIGSAFGVSGSNYNHLFLTDNCANFGQIEMNLHSDFGGFADVSGLVGAYSEAQNDVKINWSYNLGTLKWSGSNICVGGLMGLEEADTASSEYAHIDHSYSVCSYEGSLEGNYVGSVVGYAKSTTAPITVSNSFGVAINRTLPAFGYFDNAYTNNVKGYAWEEVYRDLNISGFYLPSSKFNQPTKTATFFDLICPMNTKIFPTDTVEAKRLHNAVLMNGYKRYVKTNRK